MRLAHLERVAKAAGDVQPAQSAQRLLDLVETDLRKISSVNNHQMRGAAPTHQLVADDTDACPAGEYWAFEICTSQLKAVTFIQNVTQLLTRFPQASAGLFKTLDSALADLDGRVGFVDGVCAGRRSQ